MKKRTGAPVIVRRGGPIRRRRPSSELVVERVQRKKPNRPKPVQQQKKKKKKPTPPPQKKKVQKRRIRLDPKQYPPEKRRGRFWRLGEDGLPENEKVRGLTIQCIKALIEFFPKLFTDDHSKMKALKVGILKDIMQSEFRGRFNNKIIRMALMVYCASDTYLKITQDSGERYDLEGNMVGSFCNTESLNTSERFKNFWV